MRTAERWVSVAVVAQHLEVARDPVRRWMDARGLAAYKTGGLPTFTRSEAHDSRGPEDADEAAAAQSPK